MSIECKTLRIQQSDSVVEVILNRPDVRNAFNPEMIKELTSVFKSLSKQKDLRAVVLKGEGKSFCAGGDLNWMQQMVKYSLEKNKKDSHQLFEMFDAIYKCPHPILGQVHGAAFGGGLGLVACCDIVLAEDATQFCFSEVKIGLAPAVISHFVLKKVGLGLAAPWMLTGRVFCSAQAQALGLVHFVAKGEQLTSQTNALLNELGSAGPNAVREAKKLIHKISGLSETKSKSEVTKVIATLRVGAEGQEGMTSFLSKKTPSWKSQWKARS